jgi:hypothetical protein
MFSELLYNFLININILSFFISFLLLIIFLHILDDFYRNYKDAIAFVLLPINVVINILFAPIFYSLDFSKVFLAS